MSTPRYDWWPYVKGMIRRYPVLKQKYDDLHGTSVTACLTGMPRGGGISNPTANVALRELPPINQREYEAVHKAIERTERLKDGPDRLKVIRLVLWDKSHTLSGAALEVPCSESTAWRWHGEFIRLVAADFGLLDDVDSLEPKNRDMIVS